MLEVYTQMTVKTLFEKGYKQAQMIGNHRNK